MDHLGGGLPSRDCSWTWAVPAAADAAVQGCAYCSPTPWELKPKLITTFASGNKKVLGNQDCRLFAAGNGGALIDENMCLGY